RDRMRERRNRIAAAASNKKDKDISKKTKKKQEKAGSILEQTVETDPCSSLHELLS
ncbi:Uncharacterized protein DAT39_009789, partial [Clarias magur]